MNVYELEVMLWHYNRMDAWPANGEQYQETLIRLRKLDLVDAMTRLTARGQKYMDMLFAVPLPVAQWRDPRDATTAAISPDEKFFEGKQWGKSQAHAWPDDRKVSKPTPEGARRAEIYVNNRGCGPTTESYRE